MGKSKKRRKKSIESYEKLIQEHEEKRKAYRGPKDYLKEYWEKQIKTFEEEMKKEKEKEKEKLKE